MKKDRFTFSYVGKIENRFAFRAPTWNTRQRNSLDALDFENYVLEWLMTNSKSGCWSLGNGGSTPNFSSLVSISFKTGSALCLTLSRATDVMKFEREFNVRYLDPTILIDQQDTVPQVFSLAA